MRFYELAVGAEFVFRGRRFVKTAMSMAEVLADGPERGWGNVFLGETEVVSEGPLLPPEVAARWKPERGPWAAVIEAMLTSSPSDEHSQPGVSPGPG